MFPKRSFTHDEIVEEVVNNVNLTKRSEVSSAFLESLSSGRLDLRSALGSYAVGRLLRPHKGRCSGSLVVLCDVCGAHYHQRNMDVSVLNFERLKWAGVRHLWLIYIAFDLAQFRRCYQPDPEARQTGVEQMLKLLDSVSALPDKAGASDAARCIRKVVNVDESQRGTIIEILSFCGILAARQYPGFFRSFVRYGNRLLPAVPRLNFHYPACWWHARDGVNLAALKYFFPDVARLWKLKRRARGATKVSETVFSESSG